MACPDGFGHFVNHAEAAGAVSITAVDDTGTEFGPVSVFIEASRAIEFSTSDLERGNTQLGIATGIGAGQGDWRLVLETDLPIEPLTYVQAPSGFLDRLDRAVPGGSFGMGHCGKPDTDVMGGGRASAASARALGGAGRELRDSPERLAGGPDGLSPGLTCVFADVSRVHLFAAVSVK